MFAISPKIDKNTPEYKASQKEFQDRLAEVRASREAAAEKRKQQAAVKTISDFNTGDTCTLADSGAVLAATVDDYNRFTKLSVARDGIEAARMESEGRIARLAERTTIKIINSGFLRAEVRVQDGPRKGEHGFISAEFPASK